MVLAKLPSSHSWAGPRRTGRYRLLHVESSLGGALHAVCPVRPRQHEKDASVSAPFRTVGQTEPRNRYGRARQIDYFFLCCILNKKVNLHAR